MRYFCRLESQFRKKEKLVPLNGVFLFTDVGDEVLICIKLT